MVPGAGPCSANILFQVAMQAGSVAQSMIARVLPVAIEEKRKHHLLQFDFRSEFTAQKSRRTQPKSSRNPVMPGRPCHDTFGCRFAYRAQWKRSYV
jgi:hypothetical protein